MFRSVTIIFRIQLSFFRNPLFPTGKILKKTTFLSFSLSLFCFTFSLLFKFFLCPSSISHLSLSDSSYHPSHSTSISWLACALIFTNKRLGKEIILSKQHIYDLKLFCVQLLSFYISKERERELPLKFFKFKWNACLSCFYDMNYLFKYLNVIT